MRITAAALCTLWGFFILRVIDGITIRPSEISFTTSKPMMPMRMLNKTIEGEVQMTSSDNRIRRLIPYMSYYYPHQEYNNYPLEYLPLSIQQQIVRKKPLQQIPNIAYLYGGSKYATPRPAVQAGFIYKARPEPYKTFVPVQQPHMQPSYNSYKYQPAPNVYHQQQQPAVHHKTVATSDKNNYTPFLNTNKLPGEFMPIFKTQNLPYKSYEIVGDVSSTSSQSHPMKPLDDDEFIPMNPSPVYYHKSQPFSNHLYHTKHIPLSDHQQKSSKPLTYSNPTPVFITSAPEYHDESTENPFESTKSHEYEEILVYHPTTQRPEFHTVKVTTFAPDENYLQKVKAVHKQKPHNLPDLHAKPLSDILTKLQKSNHLPDTLKPENVDNSVKTLVKILNNLKQKETAQKPPPEYTNHAVDDYDEYDDDTVKDGSPGPNSGRPGIDYPNFHEIPETNFSCKEQRYKGFFGDPDTKCQVWHYCDLNGGKASFLCPNGTIFSQVALTCDWWFNVKCATTPQLYVLNERLYKYILPFTPKFPEDYSGPLVDKYLAIKFQEMEEKLQKDKEDKEEKKQKEAVEAKLKAAEEKDKIEIEEIPESGPEISEVTEITSVEEITTERSLIYDGNSPRFPSSDAKNNFQPSYSTDSHVPYQPSLLDEIHQSDSEITYTPGPIRVPTAEALEAEAENFITVSDLPPIPDTIVEQERLEMIEINNDGTSGHLSHSLP